MRLIDSGRLDPSMFATHRFALGGHDGAYDTFADAASTKALKVVLEGSPRDPSSNGHVDASLVAGVVMSENRKSKLAGVARAPHRRSGWF